MSLHGRVIARGPRTWSGLTAPQQRPGVLAHANMVDLLQYIKDARRKDVKR